MGDNAKRDENFIPTLLGVSNVDGTTPVVLYADPVTHRLLVSAVPGDLNSLSDVVITGEAQGDILFFDGSDWVNLGTGTVGQTLTSGGAGADVVWSNAGVGDMTIAVYDPAGVSEQLVGLTAAQTLTNKTITTPLGIIASDIEMSELGTATYDDLQDWSNSTQSAGVIAGGVITDGGSGTIDVSDVKGVVKTTNSEIGANVYFDLTGLTAQALTDNSTNYIAVDYNAGTPQFVVGVTNTANGRTIFNLGKIYREGTSLDIIDSGLNIYDFSKRVQQHHIEESGLHFTSGAVVGETGERYITVTAGVMYAGLNRIITDAVDTSGADTYELYYNDGAWQEASASQIDNLQYNNFGVGLATLGNNQYGIFWVYKGTNSTTFVVYGQDSYLLSSAEAAQPPASLPDHISGFGELRAKIIVQKSGTNFTEIQSVEDVDFTSSVASNHNELANIQGGTADEYYHLTSARHTEIVDWLSNGVDLSTDVTGELPTANVADEAITYAKIQNMATAKILGRTTAGSGVIEELDTIPTAVQQNITLLGTQAEALEMGGFDINNGGVIFLTEQASAEADVAGKGQFWVKTATPNEIWFTDDTGVDRELGKHRFMVQLLDSATDQATDTGIQGDFRISKRAIKILDVGAYVDTAGVTGTCTIDINEAGTTILSTKITIDTTEKSSETAATPPVVSDDSIAADAIISFDIDGIHSGTAAKGLKVWVDYIYV